MAAPAPVEDTRRRRHRGGDTTAVPELLSAERAAEITALAPTYVRKAFDEARQAGRPYIIKPRGRSGLRLIRSMLEQFLLDLDEPRDVEPDEELPKTVHRGQF